jgi:hypothetical protein
LIFGFSRCHLRLSIHRGRIIKSIPSPTYRDSVGVAVTLGELKSGKNVRDTKEVKATEQPSMKGGRIAATCSISAAAIANHLAGIHFPKNKDSLKTMQRRNYLKLINSSNSNKILKKLNRLPDREFHDMADVEKSVGNVI